jgi:hypothetical protein
LTTETRRTGGVSTTSSDAARCWSWFRDGATIKNAVPDLSKDNRLFEQGLLRVLEYFLRHPGACLKRTKIESEIGNLEPYLGRIRKLLNDDAPYRIIQKAGPGGGPVH